MKSPDRTEMFLMAPAVLGYLGVAVAGMFDLGNSPLRLPAIVLLVLFGLLYFIPVSSHASIRRLHLWIALQTILVSCLLLIEPGWSVFPLLFMLMGPEVTGWFPTRMGAVWIGIFTLCTGVIFVAFRGVSGLISLFPYAAGYSFFAIFGWMRYQAEADRCKSEKLLAELQQAHRQLQEYAARVEELSIAQERNRIAREMHDAIGHRLTIASVQLEGAQRLIATDPERAGRILETSREQVREGLGELRRTVAMLRASVDEDLPIQQALGKLATQVEEATGIKIHLSLEDCPIALSSPYRQALYRAAQEGLTNISRHAKASDAWIQLNFQDGKITLLISDNGIGIPASQAEAGFGLIGIKERAAILGGESFIDPRPGGGTQLTFRLPLPEEKENE